MMSYLQSLFDLVLHLDKHLQGMVTIYAEWTYLLLFAVIFVETGLVVMFFLPGDSLLFAVGMLAGLGLLSLPLLFFLLVVAAISGDSLNYWLGNRVGIRAFDKGYPLLKQSHLESAQHFFAKYGGKAIILARFFPVIRTFVPFIAGIAAMDYRRFFFYNVGGGIMWVALFLFGGYFFGTLPIVQANFYLVVPAIILLSLIPIVVESVQVTITKWQVAKI